MAETASVLNNDDQQGAGEEVEGPGEQGRARGIGRARGEIMNSYRAIEYAFMMDAWVDGKWEHEVGTRKLTQAMEVAGLYLRLFPLGARCSTAGVPFSNDCR